MQGDAYDPGSGAPLREVPQYPQSAEKPDGGLKT